MKEVREGSAVIQAPAQSLTRKSDVFYNPAMEYQRDMTMAALREYIRMGRSELTACDPLAGTGIRSIRMLKEVSGMGCVTINDGNPKAAELIRSNLRLNGLDADNRAEVANKSANLLFQERRKAYDYIDIDPFGSPLGFIYNAGHALRHGGMLAVTATDTGALCGAFASTCFSRYGIMSAKTDFFKELGARALITATMSELSKQGMAFKPLYAHANHYFRAMGIASARKSDLTRQMAQVRLLVYCRRCLYRSMDLASACPHCGGKLDVLGPLWTGPIKDDDFCRGMLKDLESAGYRRTRELSAAVAELDVPFYYDTPRVFRYLRKAPGRIDSLIEALSAAGHRASRTHLCPTGIKTDAPHEAVLKAFM